MWTAVGVTPFELLWWVWETKAWMACWSNQSLAPEVVEILGFLVRSMVRTMVFPLSYLKDCVVAVVMAWRVACVGLDTMGGNCAFCLIFCCQILMFVGLFSSFLIDDPSPSCVWCCWWEILPPSSGCGKVKLLIQSCTQDTNGAKCLGSCWSFEITKTAGDNARGRLAAFWVCACEVRSLRDRAVQFPSSRCRPGGDTVRLLML